MKVCNFTVHILDLGVCFLKNRSLSKVAHYKLSTTSCFCSDTATIGVKNKLLGLK